MVVWLVLAIAGPNAYNTAPAMMHVGNYTSYSACQTAAKDATYPVRPLANNAQPTFICIRANDAGSKPPPY
jgi:hypothetical protein